MIPKALSVVPDQSSFFFTEGEDDIFSLMEGNEQGIEPIQVVSYPEIKDTKLFTYSPEKKTFYIVQDNKIRSFQRDREPQSLINTQEPITAITTRAGKLFYATGKNLYSYSPKSKRTVLLRQAEQPVTDIYPLNIRKFGSGKELVVFA